MTAHFTWRGVYIVCLTPSVCGVGWKRNWKRRQTNGHDCWPHTQICNIFIPYFIDGLHSLTHSTPNSHFDRPKITPNDVTRYTLSRCRSIFSWQIHSNAVIPWVAQMDLGTYNIHNTMHAAKDEKKRQRRERAARTKESRFSRLFIREASIWAFRGNKEKRKNGTTIWKSVARVHCNCRYTQHTAWLLCWRVGVCVCVTDNSF